MLFYCILKKKKEDVAVFKYTINVSNDKFIAINIYY